MTPATKPTQFDNLRNGEAISSPAIVRSLALEPYIATDTIAGACFDGDLQQPPVVKRPIVQCRTCSRCSAFKPLDGISGRCSEFDMTGVPICKACEHVVNGWDIEWQPSGLRWEAYDQSGQIFWDLKSGSRYVGAVYRDADEWSARWDYSDQEIRFDDIRDAARALVAAVKGCKDG